MALLSVSLTARKGQGRTRCKITHKGYQEEGGLTEWLSVYSVALRSTKRASGGVRLLPNFSFPARYRGSFLRLDPNCKKCPGFRIPGVGVSPLLTNWVTDCPPPPLNVTPMTPLFVSLDLFFRSFFSLNALNEVSHSGLRHLATPRNNSLTA